MDKHKDLHCYTMCEEPTCSGVQQLNEEELPVVDNAVWSNFLTPIKENALAVLVTTLQPSNELINSQDKMRENCSLSIPDHFEQWQASNSNNQVLEIIKNLQDFEDGWNKGGHFGPRWFDSKKSPRLIKVGKGSSVNHPGVSSGIFSFTLSMVGIT